MARRSERVIEPTLRWSPDQPTERSASQSSSVSPLRALIVQEMKAINYLFATRETTLNEVVQPITEIMEKLEHAIRRGDVPVGGPALFIYHGAAPDPTKKFTIEIGFPVEEGAKAFDEFKVKQVEPFRCATVLFSGPMSQIGQAVKAAQDGDAQRPVVISADKDVKYDTVVTAMNQLKRAGIERVGLSVTATGGGPRR